MKITLFVTVALSAVVGIALADDGWNNNDWNNNNNNNGGIGGIVGGHGGISMGGVSMGSMGGGYFGSGYGSGYGAGYGSGYGSGYGASYGGAQATYVPVPATGGSGFDIGSILPIFGLLFLLPLLFNTSTGTQDQIILLNSTLEG